MDSKDVFLTPGGQDRCNDKRIRMSIKQLAIVEDYHMHKCKKL